MWPEGQVSAIGGELDPVDLGARRHWNGKRRARLAASQGGPELPVAIGLPNARKQISLLPRQLPGGIGRSRVVRDDANRHQLDAPAGHAIAVEPLTHLELDGPVGAGKPGSGDRAGQGRNPASGRAIEQVERRSLRPRGEAAGAAPDQRRAGNERGGARGDRLGPLAGGIGPKPGIGLRKFG